MVLPELPKTSKNRIHSRILLPSMRHPNSSSSHGHRSIQKSENMHNMRIDDLTIDEQSYYYARHKT